MIYNLTVCMIFVLIFGKFNYEYSSAKMYPHNLKEIKEFLLDIFLREKNVSFKNILIPKIFHS